MIRSIGTWLWLLPRNVLIAVMMLYRKFISPIYGDVCRYYPTCSAYAVEALHRFGVLKGVYLTTKRLVRCHPWAAGGVDKVPGASETFDPSVLGFAHERKV